MSQRHRSSGADKAVLADSVQRLQAEVDGLRRAQQHRAVIEQAKGLLAGRLTCSPEEAFSHLTAMSQRANMKVVEVAAGLLGLAVPVPPPDQGRPRSDVDLLGVPKSADAGTGIGTGIAAAPLVAELPEEATARYHLTCAAMSGAEDADQLAARLWADGLRQLGVTAVVLGVLEPDGAVRLVGTHGLPAGLVSAWQRVPSTLNVAFLRAVADDRTLWLSRKQAAELGYELFGEGEMRACLPLRHQGHTFGVASVIWAEPTEPDDYTRAYVNALVEACGRRLTQLLHSADEAGSVASPAAHWVDAVLEALPGNFALLCPVRDESGVVVDWCINRCSPQAADAFGRGAEQLVGRRLLDLYPHLADTGLIEGYERALRTGVPFEYKVEQQVLARHPRQATSTFSVRGARFGDGVLAHWRHHDVELSLQQRLSHLERVGDLGWAEWNLATGAVEWSPKVYEILQREPGDGPVKLGALHRYVQAADASTMQHAVHTLTRDCAPVDVRVQLRRHGVGIGLRFAGEPVTDAEGRLTAVRVVLHRLPHQRVVCEVMPVSLRG